MKPASRPQYYRIKRIVDMVREGSEGGYLPKSTIEKIITTTVAASFLLE